MAEWYVRDCSRKQKAQYQVRGKSGKPVTNNIPYGFKKDRSEKHHWLVDEEAADVVRRIFSLSIEGMRPNQIAKALMQGKVERPSCYLAKQGRGTCQNSTDMFRPYDRNATTVKEILAKSECMGHTVNFRSYKPSYKNKKNDRASAVGMADFPSVDKKDATANRYCRTVCSASWVGILLTN